MASRWSATASWTHGIRYVGARAVVASSGDTRLRLLSHHPQCALLQTVEGADGFQFAVAALTAGEGSCVTNPGFVGQAVFDRATGAWDISAIVACLPQPKAACEAMTSGYDLACATMASHLSVRACATAAAGHYLSGGIALKCSDQEGCASSESACSTTAGITEKLSCAGMWAGFERALCSLEPP